jgi:ArsR family transcriptional regulator
MAKPAPLETNHLTDSEEVFEKAADIFRVMSAPMRLRIISALCNGEKNVGDLLAEIDTTQPNMSQHLNTLYQAGVVGKRREFVAELDGALDKSIHIGHSGGGAQYARAAWPSDSDRRCELSHAPLWHCPHPV